MIRRRLFRITALVVSALLAAPLTAAADYPEGPITLIVPWAEGGGTDATARMIAPLLAKQLGQPVNVVNRPGENGLVGHGEIAAAAPDGYTIGIATVEIGMLHWAGATGLTHRDFTPIGLYNTDPAGLQVAADSPYESARDVIAAIRANPGKFKASGSGQGGIWHLALAGLLDAAGIDPTTVTWVPSKGAAPALEELANGGVDFVTSSVGEAGPLKQAGKVRSLMVMSDRRLVGFTDLPTSMEATGLIWTLSAWRGLVGPKGLPPAVVSRLTSALKTVASSAEFRNFMIERGFGMVWRRGPDFEKWMADSDVVLGRVMKAVGIAR